MRCGNTLWILVLLSGALCHATQVEIAFSFDTTGSMYPVIDEVRYVLYDMIGRLQSDIPGIRMAVFAHGDYSDAQNTYDEKHLDLTTDGQALQDFVSNVERTGGGDLPEAYELVLYRANRNISWTNSAQRSLVMIGDANPHLPNYEDNVLNIDWQEEARQLAEKGIKVYAIQALDYNTKDFYQGLADITGGYYLKLDNFDSIFDFIMAISYREFGLEYLEAYESEVEARPEGITQELALLFESLKEESRLDGNTTESDDVKPTTTPEPTLPPVPPTIPPPVINKNLKIYEMHVKSDISYRYAYTQVNCKIANINDNATEASFDVKLPKQAFISNFSMIIEGVEYPGHVKEKEKAKKVYDEAVSRGESAGQVIAAPRHTNEFCVKVNIAPGSKVTFKLTYEELLERRLGIYEHELFIDPGQLVRNMSIVVNISESRDLRYVKVPPMKYDQINSISTDEDPMSYEIHRTPKTALVEYRPSIEEQQKMTEWGLRGKFIVQYDVERTLDAGEIHVVDGYFVHFFAPEGLPPTPKDIVFVLDTSGSMRIGKLDQLKQAMSTILDQLRPEDRFNILAFSSFFRPWQPAEEGLVEASEENTNKAREWIGKAFPAGGTNINTAIERGIDMLNVSSSSRPSNSPGASIIIFLTDGEPTDGVTSKKEILKKVKARNCNDDYMLFALGLGNEVDMGFLQQLSAQNNGIARKIYADSDASLQLEGFFSEIASPVLSNVNISYIGDTVMQDQLTMNDFKTYFNGTEIIICGILTNPQVDSIETDIQALSLDGQTHFQMLKPLRLGTVQNLIPFSQQSSTEDPVGAPPGLQNTIRRMWAYLTTQQLIKQSMETTDKDMKAEIKERALNMSLEYNFVTSLTSMVVTRPQENSTSADVVDPDLKKDAKDDVKAYKKKPSHAKRPAGGPYGSPESMDLDYAMVGSRLKGPPGMYAPEPPFHKTSYADHDPHFVVNVKGSEQPLCFDVMGTPGEVYQLIHDNVTGITVNAMIVGKSSVVESKPRKTYMGNITIITPELRFSLNPKRIKEDIKYDQTLHWEVPQSWHGEGFNLTIEKARVTIELENDVVFQIIRHKVKKHHPEKVDYLGFYIMDDSGLSATTHGLLGQFQSMEVDIDVVPSFEDDESSGDWDAGREEDYGPIPLLVEGIEGKPIHHSLRIPRSERRIEKGTVAQLTFLSDLDKEPILVNFGERHNADADKKIPCWFAHNGGRTLLDGQTEFYKVPRLQFNRLARRVKRHLSR